MKEFTCPKCGSHRLEEVMTNVTIYSPIKSYSIEDGEIDFEYGNQNNEDGAVERYQCMDCGEHIAFDQAELIAFLEG